MLLKQWKSLEINHKSPNEIRNVKKINFENFLNKINSKKESIKIINNLYQGDVYLIRNTISKKFILDLKKYLIDKAKIDPSSFYKIKEGCPNFNRIIKKKHKKYSVSSFRHAFYFFRWNKEKIKIFKNFDKIWDKIKYLNGYKFNSFKKNTPRDGLIDRIQVHRYPNNSGEIEPHQHNPKNIRVILNVYLSKKGKDFNQGGIFFKKKIKNLKLRKILM